MKKEEYKLGWLDLIKSVWYFLEGSRKKYVFFTVVLFLVFFYGLVPTFVVGKIVDFFAGYKNGDSLNPFYFYVFFLGAGTALVAIIRLTTKNILGDIRSESMYQVRVKGFERLLDLSIKWHDEENTGNKVQRIQNGAEALKNIQDIAVNNIFMQLTAVIGVVAAFLFLNPLFAFYSVVYLTIFFFIQTVFYNKIKKVQTEANYAMEQASGTYYEGLSNVLTIKTLGVKEDFRENINEKEQTFRDFAIRLRKLGINKWKSFQVFNAISLTFILFMVGKGFIEGAITLGSILIYYNYFDKLANSLGESTSLIDDLVADKISISRMMPIFHADIISHNGKLNFPENWEKINIVNGNFTYKEGTEKEDSAIKNLNISINRFEKVGIVGKSGCGKSTLAKLLLGLYELENGKFLIDDTDFYKIKHSQITGEIALVLQESEMFNLTLRDNITLMRKLDNDLLKRAIEVASLNDLIQKLPDGLDTFIGEKGYRLSGGERQRIGIARAIYKNPQILVLDEATSSLDSRTERNIQENLEKLEKKTLIIIAHRISTLKNADRIIVFENGEIIEQGKYSQLENNENSVFYKIYKQQEKKH